MCVCNATLREQRADGEEKVIVVFSVHFLLLSNRCYLYLLRTKRGRQKNDASLSITLSFYHAVILIMLFDLFLCKAVDILDVSTLFKMEIRKLPHCLTRVSSQARSIFRLFSYRSRMHESNRQRQS